MPSEAARLDPEGRGAARRGGCFNPPQYRPDTNLLGFRVLNFLNFEAQSGQMTRKALERETRRKPTATRPLSWAGSSGASVPPAAAARRLSMRSGQTGGLSLEPRAARNIPTSRASSSRRQAIPCNQSGASLRSPLALSFARPLQHFEL